MNSHGFRKIIWRSILLAGLLVLVVVIANVSASSGSESMGNNSISFSYSPGPLTVCQNDPLNIARQAVNTKFCTPLAAGSSSRPTPWR